MNEMGVLMENRIAEIYLERLSLPLTIPYKLAFGPVTAFDTVIAHISDDSGRSGFGEATILTGYTPETIEGCWARIQEIGASLIGLSTEDAKAEAFRHHHDAPFTVTSLITGIEMLEGHPALNPIKPVDVPLLAILSTMDEAGIAKEINRHVEDGYKTIKVKIGWGVEDDLKRIAFIQSCLPNHVRIRIDGNQGYSKEDGITFATRVNPDKIELLEQPCHMDDWDAAAAVAKVSGVPFMLDESIYGEAEIERAANMETVQFVKLKLMKTGSIENLQKQLGLIKSMGMTPVLGNGVAADPGCWMECCVAMTMIDNAGEMNGFLKPVDGLFDIPLVVKGGAVTLPQKYPSLIDTSPFRRDTMTYGRQV